MWDYKIWTKKLPNQTDSFFQYSVDEIPNEMGEKQTNK